MDEYLEVLKKYAVFSGRARRQEYWTFFFFDALIVFGFVIIERIIGNSDIALINRLTVPIVYKLAVLIPCIALTVRRLHDTNRSALWLLFSLIPFIGFIVFFVFMVQDSKPGENQYEANPKTETALGNVVKKYIGLCVIIFLSLLLIYLIVHSIQINSYTGDNRTVQSYTKHGFVDNGDGTVTDSSTGLMWQQATQAGGRRWEPVVKYYKLESICNSLGLGPIRELLGIEYGKSWVSAIAYCNSLSLAGHDDWRLPSRDELQSLVNYTREKPAINTFFFPRVMKSPYWSSTTTIGTLDSRDAYYVSFYDGEVDTGYKSGIYEVLAVRNLY